MAVPLAPCTFPNCGLCCISNYFASANSLLILMKGQDEVEFMCSAAFRKWYTMIPNQWFSFTCSVSAIPMALDPPSIVGRHPAQKLLGVIIDNHEAMFVCFRVEG